MPPCAAPYLIPSNVNRPTPTLSNLMTERQAAEYLTVSRAVMTVWRKQKIGPAYVQMNGRVCYRAEDLAIFVYDRIVKCGRVPSPRGSPRGPYKKRKVTTPSPSSI